MPTGAITWTWAANSTLYSCGCLTNTTTSPATLIQWCGQPYCLRLAAANVAYTQAQFNWQTANGYAPVLVPALSRIMVTPLPQVLPPPTGGQYFMLPLPGEIPHPPSGTISGSSADVQTAAEKPAKPPEKPSHETPPHHQKR